MWPTGLFNFVAFVKAASCAGVAASSNGSDGAVMRAPSAAALPAAGMKSPESVPSPDANTPV